MKFLKIFTITVSLFVLSNSVFAQGAGIEWDILNQEVITEYRQGNYKKATQIAKIALKVAEENVGADHPNVATSLENMAFLYRATNRDSEAKKLEKRAREIRNSRR